MHLHVLQVGHAGADYGSMGHLSGSQCMCLMAFAHSQRAIASSLSTQCSQVQFEARVWDCVLFGWSYCAQLLQLHRATFRVRFRSHQLQTAQYGLKPDHALHPQPSSGERQVHLHTCCHDAARKTCARSTMKSSPSSPMTPPPGTDSEGECVEVSKNECRVEARVLIWVRV